MLRTFEEEWYEYGVIEDILMFMKLASVRMVLPYKHLFEKQDIPDNGQDVIETNVNLAHWHTYLHTAECGEIENNCIIL